MAATLEKLKDWIRAGLRSLFAPGSPHDPW